MKILLRDEGYLLLKERFGKKYDSVFVFNDSISEILANKGHKSTSPIVYTHLFENENTETFSKYQHEYERLLCVIEGEFFTYVSTDTYIDRNDIMLDGNLLFINKKDFELFFNKYLKGEKQKRVKMKYKPGLYSIAFNPMFGYYLEKQECREFDPPILKDNLQNSLKREIDMFCKNKHIYDELSLDYKRGILLYGPPGNGKTSFIRYFASQMDAVSIMANLNDSDDIKFLQSFLSSNDMADMLKIVIIEDIDGLNSFSRSFLLNLLDGMEESKKTVFIATTNFPDKLDIAIRNRPSRFDSMHYIGLPETKEREMLLKKFFPDIDNSHMSRCVSESEGFSGAYFKEIYIYSRLNDLTPLESVQELRKRIEKMKEIDES
jgi:hypothetical protein